VDKPSFLDSEAWRLVDKRIREIRFAVMDELREAAGTGNAVMSARLAGVLDGFDRVANFPQELFPEAKKPLSADKR